MCISFSLVCCQDGEHVAKKAKWDVEVTDEQRKVMRTQDIKYVEMKRVAEAKVRGSIAFFQQRSLAESLLHLIYLTCVLR